MSVTNAVQPLTFPLAFVDPRSPIATWWGTPVGTGDASGGFNRARILLARPSLYSVEGVGILTSVAVAVLVNFSPGRSGFGWTFMATTVAGGLGFAPPGDQLRRSWGELIVDPGPDADAAIDADIVNVLAGTVELDAWGFIWDREALKHPGGPRRPKRLIFSPGGG